MKRHSVLLATMLMFALLVLTLDAQSLWWDEGISLHLATSTWADIIADRATNIHPPLYFFALKLWTSLAGASAFSGRLFSVFAVTLIPAFAWRFLKRRLHVDAPWSGAFILALMPPLIVYGQETRAYAWLTLLWLLLIDRTWHSLSKVPSRNNQRAAIRFGLVTALLEACLVLFHYSGIFGVVAINLAYVIDILRTRNRQRLTAWLVSCVALIGFGVIWLIPVLYYGITNMSEHAGIANVFAEPVSWDYVIRLLGTFQVFGVPFLNIGNVLRYVMALTVIAGSAAIVYALSHNQTRRITLLLLAIWLIPFLAAPYIWGSSPQSHPRYLMPYMIGGWLLVVWLVSEDVAPKFLRLVLSAGVIAVFGLGLYRYLTDTSLYKSDVRALAAYLRDVDSDSVVIVPDTDWSLAQYDTGGVRVLMPSVPKELVDFQAWFDAEVADHDTVYLLDYERDVLDPADQLRSAVVNVGWFEQRIDAHGVFLEQYDLDAPKPKAKKLLINACTQQGLCLGTAYLPVNVVAGAQVGVRLNWHLNSVHLEKRYVVALRLYAPSGALVASLDDQLVTTENLPTDYWISGEVAETYHVLDVPTGALPVGYTLRVGVYEGDVPEQTITLYRQGEAPSADVIIGVVTPLEELWRSDAGFVDDDRRVLDGLPAELTNWHIDRSVVSPGDSVYVSLHWLSQKLCSEQMIKLLAVDSTGSVYADALPWQAFCNLPTGRPLLDVMRLDVPVGIPGGDYQLVLASDKTTVFLGNVIVSDVPHSFQVPDISTTPVYQNASRVATLVGYDIGTTDESTVEAGVPFQVTLVWRALMNANVNDLKIFVHLYASDGSMIAQHDGIPVDWSRPTTGWVDGEYIVDVHDLMWQQVYSGPAYVAVGLYNPGTGVRVLWDNGEDVLSLADIKVE